MQSLARTIFSLGALVLLLATGCQGPALGADPSDDLLYPDGKQDSIRRSELPIQMQPPIEGAFAQEIDHPAKGGPSLGTFQQRYWYSTEFARNGEQSPVL